jgi:hypothetical protein
MSDLYLCLDPGGSQTKIIYQLKGDESPNFLLMSPEVEQISESKLNNYMSTIGWIGSPILANQAWLKVNDKIFVVGAFATKFDPDDRLSELKYENALYKVLAAVGVIVKSAGLSTRQKLSLQLAILLPWNEYSDRKRFKSHIESLLKSFAFQDSSLKVKLDRFVCRPEGGGLAAIRILQKGVGWLQNSRMGVVMLGHRNTTALYFESGELKSGDSPLIGFSQFLDSVIERTSGLSSDSLARALFRELRRLIREDLSSTLGQKHVYQFLNNKSRPKYLAYRIHPQWQDLSSIQSLAKAKDNQLRSSEILDISAAIKLATVEYEEKLQKWLKKSFPRGLDEVIISGGAVQFLEPLLEQFFNCCLNLDSFQNYSLSEKKFDENYYPRDENLPFTRIIWGAGVHQHLEEVLNLNGTRGRESFLRFLLMDAYGLFDYLIALNEDSPKSEKQLKTNDLDKE